MFNSLQFILKSRNYSDVSEANPFVFGIPGSRDKFIEACALLRIHSTRCGASRPDLLRGTHLRKHIATRSVLLNLSDSQISDLANCMWYSEQIHKSHYRLPIVAREITEISSLLQKAQGGDLHLDSSADKELEQSFGGEFERNLTENESYSDVNESFGDVNMSDISTVNTFREEICKLDKLKIYTFVYFILYVVGRYLPSEQKTPWTTTEIQVAREVFKKHVLEKTAPKIN